ncbi:MAG: hypothetical protein Q8O67_23190 [Deltaproteobacteria bacterium]|nr:hypothetical protein [Deltaproteobacteria bacterium]
MRVVVVWCVLATALSALAAAEVTAGLERAHAIVFCMLYAAITAAGVSSSTAVAALRRNQVHVAAGGDVDVPAWGVWRRALLPMIVAAAAGAAVAVVVQRSAGGILRHLPFWMLWSSSLLAVILARALVKVPTRVTPIARSRVRWLVVEGALPAAIMAGVVGVVVAVVRFGSVASVSPGALSRTLAGTCLCYALLGLGGFAKAFHEHKAGVVVVDAKPVRGLPGPIFLGLAIAAGVAVIGPWVLPAIEGAHVGIVKGVVGVVVGGALSLLGALAGHRAAAATRSSH